MQFASRYVVNALFAPNIIILKFRKLSERPDMREKTYSFTIEEIPIIVTKKRMKNMYLRISKEDGSVRISAPHQMSDERIYRFAKERIDWIRVYREKYLRAKEGRREVRQLSEAELKQQKLLLKRDVEKLIAKWEPVMGVKASGVTIRQMKTRWGSCNVRTHHISISHWRKSRRSVWSMWSCMS